MRKVALFLAVAIASAATYTQPARAEQDKATEVLAAVQKAIGGGKLESMKTFSLQAKTARNAGTRQLTSEVELYIEMPDKFLRVENLAAPIATTMQVGFNGDKPIRPQGGPMMAGGGAPVVIMNGGPGMAGGGAGMARTEMVMVAGASAAMGGGTRGGGPGGNQPMTPEQQALANTVMVRNQRIEASRMMLGWFGMAHPALKATYTYAGEAESPDGKAHVINVKADGGFEAKLFVDQKTNLPLMLQWTTMERPPFNFNSGTTPGAAGAPVVSGGNPPPPPPPPPGGAATTTTTTTSSSSTQTSTRMTPERQAEMQKAFEEWQKTPPSIAVEQRIFFADWKEVDGIQFPHVLQRARQGTTTEEWTIEKVKVNPKIDAKKFDAK